MRRTLLIMAAIAMAAAGLAGCGSSPASAIRIGAIYPLTGSQSEGGQSEQRGAALAADWVNQHGGIHGRSIALDVIDTPRAESVPSSMQRLSSAGIKLVVGTHGSTLSAAAASEAQRRGMLLWETGAVGDLHMGAYDWSPTPTDPVEPVTGEGRSFFRMSPMGASLGRAGIDFVLKQLAPRLPTQTPLRVAVAYVEDSYGRSVEQGVLAGVHDDGATLAGVFPYTQSGTNWSELARTIGQSGANVVYASSYLDDGMALRRAILDQHLPLLASVGTSSSYCLPAFGQQLQGDAVGLFASDKPSAGSINPAALLSEGRDTLQWAEGQWAKRYGGQMDAYATSGFANAYALFAHVLPAAGNPSPVAVSAAANQVKLPAGTLADGAGMNFPPPGSPQAGANQAAASVIWEWVAPGEEAIVWPPAFATHPVDVLSIVK
jgi:branched-chain amino acid transport system substrate-binding protein